MIAPIITSPTRTIIAWDEDLTVLLEGIADSASVRVKVNGTDIGTGYNPTNYTWQYSVTLSSGFVPYTFVVVSEDIFNNVSPSVSITLQINGPIILNDHYNKQHTDLEGRTHYISTSVETSLFPTSGFTTTNVTFLPYLEDWTYNNFFFSVPLITMYHRATDDSANYSIITSTDLQYALNIPRIDIPDTDIFITDVNVSLSGYTDYETVGLAILPASGNCSGHLNTEYASGSIRWGYSFQILDTTTDFSIKAIDVFNQETDANTRSLHYSLYPPIITKPGFIKKTLTINKDKYKEYFFIAGEDFIADGVQVNDDITALTGANTGITKKILAVYNTYLVTEAFPNFWEAFDTIEIARLHNPIILIDNTYDASVYTTILIVNEPLTGLIIQDQVLSVSGINISELQSIQTITADFIITDTFTYKFSDLDSLYVYPATDRPSYLSHTLYLKDENAIKGFCSPNSKKVIYSTDVLTDITFQSTLAGDYNITSSANSLLLTVGSETKPILLNTGTQSAQEIADQINSNFYNTVAGVSAGYIVLSDNYIKIETVANSANSVLGFPEIEILISIDFSPVIPVVFGQQDTNILSLAVGTKNYDIVFDRDISYSIDDIISKINFVAPNLAFKSVTGISLYAKDNIWIKTDMPRLSLDITSKGVVKYTEGDAYWETNFTISKPNLSFYIYSLDQLYKYSPSDSLQINYKIEAPALSTTNLVSPADSILLSGTYNSEGISVYLNSQLVTFYKEGAWSTTLKSLSDGDNSVSVKVTDIFGQDSDLLVFSVSYTTPTAEEPIPSPTGPRWVPTDLTHLDPTHAMRAVADPIFDTLNNIVAVLKTVSAILDVIKTFITDYANILKQLIQALLDQILALLKDLAGSGVYVLNTMSPIGHIKPYPSYFEGGYPEFVNKVVSSFDDPNDSRRPQFSSTAKVGGYIIAVDSADNIQNFFRAVKALQDLIRQTVTDDALVAPLNFQAKGENKRVVLTWNRGPGLAPNSYAIYKAVQSGGDPVYIQENYTDKNGNPAVRAVPQTDAYGNIVRMYEQIGEISDEYVFSKFKFVDGIMSAGEKAKALASGYYIGTTGEDIDNGLSNYYQVIGRILFTAKGHPSAEVVATPSNPDLELFTEPLTNWTQITNTTGQVLASRTTYEIYNKDNGLVSDNTLDLELSINGRNVIPLAIDGTSGQVQIATTYANDAANLATATYWKKREVTPTRAFVKSTNKEPFIFKDAGADTLKDPTLELKVGVGSGLQQFDTAVNSISGIPFAGHALSGVQKITIEKYPSNLDSIPFFTLNKAAAKTVADGFKAQWKASPLILSANDILDELRHLKGMKVWADSQGYIIIQDNLIPDTYRGSQIEIVKGNTVLGFEKGIYKAGPTSTPPDWYSIRTIDFIPGLSDLIDWINNLAQSLLSGVDTASKTLTDFIDLLQQRVDALTKLIEQLADTLDKLTRIFPANAGIYLLKIDFHIGGNDYFKNALINSTNTPTSTSVGYCGGIIFLVGAGNPSGARGGLDSEIGKSLAEQEALAKAAFKSLDLLLSGVGP